MKKGLILITAGLALLVCGAIQAKANDITVSGVNIKDLVSNTRVGVWLPLEGGRTFKTAYTPFFSLHGTDGTEYAVLDIGAAAPGEITKGYAFAAIGLRVDNLLERVAGSSTWVKAHVSVVELPTLEIGGGPILYNNKIRWGVSAALKF